MYPRSTDGLLLAANNETDVPSPLGNTYVALNKGLHITNRGIVTPLSPGCHTWAPRLL